MNELWAYLIMIMVIGILILVVGLWLDASIRRDEREQEQGKSQEAHPLASG